MKSMTPLKLVISGTVVFSVILVVSSVVDVEVNPIDKGFYEEELNCEPQQVHTAFGDTVYEMVLMWETLRNCSTDVFYGTNPWQIDQYANGESIYFDDHNIFGVHFVHRVKIKDLQEDWTYFYQPMSNNISSGPFYFKTPHKNATHWSQQFLVYGDLGVHTKSIPALIREALSGRYTAVLHVGDFAYDMHDEQGINTHVTNNTNTTDKSTHPSTGHGDEFMKLIEEIAAHVPYMTCPGNHEIIDDRFAHYRYRFSMPGSDWPIPLNKMWYSIDIGLVHFVSYSTEVYFIEDKQYIALQNAWLEKDLAEANKNRDVRPWIIAYGHRPMYCSNSDGDDCTTPKSLVRAGLEDIFYKHGVEIIIEAHEHSYERLWPTYREEVLQKNYEGLLAPVHLITGAAGSKEGTDAMQIVPGPWSAFQHSNESVNSYARLIVYNSSHIYWEQLSVIGNRLIDSIWIVHESHKQFDPRRLPHTPTTHKPNSVTNQQQNTGAVTGGHAPSTGSNGNNNSSSFGVDGGHESSGVLEFVSDSKTRIIIGAILGGVIFIILLTVLIVCRVRKNKNKSNQPRRWDSLDYGRKFYTNLKDMDKDADNFELDMPTSKLLDNGIE